ncbi:radical SAM protein, partial [Methanocalculus sp.]|uniref:radical SAM protein n=1 Tax=Methanocalculus sp. TaxID=2004547 RepID=UPI002715C0E6
LFGPVRSRRLRNSLGIDLVPDNTCSLDCVYCECGKTRNLSLRRAEYAPTDEILDELNHFLSTDPEIDFITLGGTGEPTLHSGISSILTSIKKEHPTYQTAVLTNSTLLHNPEVRSELSTADLILPSLDAVTREVFQKINRPAPGIYPEKMIQGLIDLRQEYKGQIWLEIFLIPNQNTTEEELHLLREAAMWIKPDRVHLNSLNRSGTEPWVAPLPDEDLMRICRFFSEKLRNVSII